MKVKLVFVPNRADHSQYLVLGTTKTSLKPDQIIQLYGRRWQIEGYFKVAKQYLRFDQTQVQSYDGLCGHMAMVSYDILALYQHEQVDTTLGDLFYNFGRTLPDIDVAFALAWLMCQLTGLSEKLGLTTAIIDELRSIYPNTA